MGPAVSHVPYVRPENDGRGSPLIALAIADGVCIRVVATPAGRNAHAQRLACPDSPGQSIWDARLEPKILMELQPIFPKNLWPKIRIAHEPNFPSVFRPKIQRDLQPKYVENLSRFSQLEIS